MSKFYEMQREIEDAHVRLRKKPIPQDCLSYNNILYLAVSHLKQRGWTDGLIVRFLGQPDELRRNPHGRADSKTRLYLLNRVEQAEASHEFGEARNARKSRRKQDNH